VRRDVRSEKPVAAIRAVAGEVLLPARPPSGGVDSPTVTASRSGGLKPRREPEPDVRAVALENAPAVAEPVQEGEAAAGRGVAV
jgi:hypothetical protein